MRRRGGDAQPEDNAQPEGSTQPEKPSEFERVIADQNVHGSDDTSDAMASVKADPTVLGWRRVLHGNRALWVLAAVAVVSLLAGVGISTMIVSPGQAAADAKPPKPGLITVPIELRTLSNDVTLRGDVKYADSVEVVLENGDRTGPAVVTGRVPEAGATFAAGAVALEVAGRPVIVLPGDLPAYRTLRLGLAGPDVVQLKDALRALGIDPGNSDTFDSATAAAVSELYGRVGYTAPEAAEDAALTLRSAREGVRSAEDSLRLARTARDKAAAGPNSAQRVGLDNAVREAERLLATAKLPSTEEKDGVVVEVPPKPTAIAAAEDALLLARTTRDAELAAPDLGSENAAIESAQRALSSAEETLTAAQEGSLTFLPSSEVLFLSGLPRRVDEVMARRGTIAQAAVMRVSGAELIIAASAAEGDAKLLKVGDKATVALDDESTLEATVSAIAPRKATGKEAGDRFDVSMALVAPTPEQIQALQGQNVRIAIPVGATAGEVLAVPAAALTAGAGGESRVEVAVPGEKDTKLVPVKTGLAAEGFVEITGEIAEGEQVVVGR